MNKGQSTKEMIIEKSASLFNTRGYAGCSLSDIMKATGLKKGGIYNHFSNKDEIALEAFSYSMDKVEAGLAKVTAAVDTDKERLISILDFYKEYAMHPVIEGGCPILNTVVDADETNPALRLLARRKTERLIRLLELIVRRGQKQREFRKDINAHAVSLIIFAGIEGALLLTKAFENQQSMDAMMDCLNSYLEHNLYQENTESS